MKEEEYRAWLLTQEYAPNSVSTKLSDARRVDRAHGDLDEHFDRDRMANLLQLFDYSSADQVAGRPNPTSLSIDGNLYNNLSGYRSAITGYRRFREASEHPVGRLSGLNREVILQAVAACDAAGSVHAFLAQLDDRGAPRNYWLIHGGKRYPSKAIVHWAMRERGIEASAGGSLCKATLEELGFVVVDWPELERARLDFLRRMDGFASFAESSGPYWDIERRYKNDLMARAGEIAGGDGDNRALGEALYRLLAVGGQGLPLSWRTLGEANAALPDLKDRFFTAIGALARSEDPAADAIVETARELEALRAAGIVGLRRGEVAAIPITVLATLNPLEASWFKISKIQAMGRRFFGRQLFAQTEFDGADLEEWLQLMRALLALMEREWGWQPRDLFDVQGFIWVALDERFDDVQEDELDPIPVWLVTSLWGDEDGTQRFIERGEWSLLHDNGSANNRRVREMQVGDRIFLKDFVPRATDLPFDAGGGLVTANRIRAAGVITEVSTDGLRVGVEWEPLAEPRTWYLYTNNNAVWRLKDPAEQHPSADRLRRFLLNSEEQDYSWFLAQPFWRDRLFSAPQSQDSAPMKPTNLILYGPPGTGKTYRTAAEAIRLCDGDVDYGDDEGGRAALMARYAELVDARQIEFVTFHQNFSYEDFVEGLRPHTGSDGEQSTSAGFSLRPEPGIFRSIAERAGRPVKTGSEGISLENRRVFKMSLGQSNDPHSDWVYDESMQDGYALFGFEDVDWSDDRFSDRDAILGELRTRLPDENVSSQRGMVKSPDRFRNQMSVGDVLIASRGLNAFRAIGLVEGPYEYAPKLHGGYSHRRKVRWLWDDPEGVPVTELMSDRRFSLDTVYELPKSSLNLAVLTRLMNSGEEGGDSSGETLPHVLIIDEINRANISKVFGELITLIEPDKRLGQPNALKVRLPYSKREFGVTANLHIIGTMNTADRSIALLDTALRRRFRFEEIAPQPSLLKPIDGINLPRVLTVINDRIEYLHDREHRIGHAFFMGCQSRAAIDAAMRDKVLPLLQEYFFDDWSRIAAVVGEGFIAKRTLPVPPGVEAGEERVSWSVREVFPSDAYGILLGEAATSASAAEEIGDDE